MMHVSFAMTAEAFADYSKTETRRFWKPDYAKRFTPGTVFMGITKDFRCGGERIHMARVISCRNDERLGDMAESSFIREGGTRYWTTRIAYIEAMGGGDSYPFALHFEHVSPWALSNDMTTAWCDAENRIRVVATWDDITTLRAALLYPGIQSTVRVAIERRLRKLGARVEPLPQKTQNAQKEVAL